MDEGAGFSGGPADGGSSRYKGVRLRKWGKWVSEIRLPNSRERIWLGSYDSPEKAARAFDAALYCLRGRQAQFNFPDSPPDIAGAQGLTPQEIRAVAAQFANQWPERSGRSRRNDDGHGASSMAAQEGGDNGNGNDGGGSSIDWSFLNALDDDCAGSGFGLYDGLDYVGGSQLEPPPEASSTTDNAEDENGGGNGFYCHQLWNF